MLSLYFVDHEHEQNYRMLVEKWKQASPFESKYGANTEYQAPIYIAALPMIFDKVGNFLIEEAKNPVDWIYRYKKWEADYKEEWENYSRYNDDELHPEHEAWIDIKPCDLTGSGIHLGDLALNMWNSSYSFNLTEAMGSFDRNSMNVLLCAIYIRNGHFKNHVV